MKEYYTCPDGQHVEGPFRWSQLLRQLKSKHIDCETMVKPEGDGEWLRLNTLREYKKWRTGILHTQWFVFIAALVSFGVFLLYNQWGNERAALRTYSLETDHIIAMHDINRLRIEDFTGYSLESQSLSRDLTFAYYDLHNPEPSPAKKRLIEGRITALKQLSVELSKVSVHGLRRS